MYLCLHLSTNGLTNFVGELSTSILQKLFLRTVLSHSGGLWLLLGYLPTNDICLDKREDGQCWTLPESCAPGKQWRLGSSPHFVFLQCLTTRAALPILRQDLCLFFLLTPIRFADDGLAYQPLQKPRFSPFSLQCSSWMNFIPIAVIWINKMISLIDQCFVFHINYRP